MKTIVFLILISMTVLSADEKTIGHWRFNEGEGTAIAGMNASPPATLSRLDENTRWVNGRSSNALHFGGDHKQRNVFGAVTMIMKPEIFTVPFTIEIWVKFDKDAPPREFKDIIGNSVERGPGFRLTYFYGSLQFRTGDGKEVKHVGTNSSQTIIPGDAWVFLTLVYDGKTGRIYVNGEEKAAGELALTKGNKVLSVGAFSSGMAYPMCGAVDEVKIYSYARSSEEITESYLKGMQ